MERRFALIKHTHFLSDLADFSVSSPADGDLIEYDSTTGKWINVPVASLTGITEAVQDILGAMLLDTASVNLTYNDGTGQLSADVLPAGVNHNALLNYVADQHVAHTGVVVTAGAGLVGGGDISLSRTLAVGAGTGIAVNADDVALSATTLASLALADSSAQPGDGLSIFTNDVGYITSLSLPIGANPSATIGLTAVNGSAGTFLRSDGAPALSQAIAPTWTGTHTFSLATLFAAGNAGAPSIAASGDTNTGIYWAGADDVRITTGGAYRLQVSSALTSINPMLLMQNSVSAFDTAQVSPLIYGSSGGGSGLFAEAGHLILQSRPSGQNRSIHFVTGTTPASRLEISTSLITAALQISLPDTGLRFTADTDTGIQRVGTNALGLIVGGQTAAVLAGGAAAPSYFTITSPSGTQSALQLTQTGVASWINYIDPSSTTLAWYSANAGVNRMQLTEAGQLLVSDGSSSSPSVSFMADTDTGLYRAGADAIGFAIGGAPCGRIQSKYASFGEAATASSVAVQLGRSGSGYASIGVNVEFTTTNGVYNYGVTDTAGLINFQNLAYAWAFQYAASGTAGTPITFDTVAAMSTNGRFYVGDGSASSPAYSFLADNNTGLYRAAADQINFSEGGTGYRIGFRDIPRRTSGFARGECLAISAGVTLNTSDMAAGYSFTVYNDSASAITITQGSGVTLRLVDTATTGNRTLAARGMAFIWCNSGTEAVISGVT